MRDEDAVTGAIERCYNRCKSEVQVRGAIRDNQKDVRCKSELQGIGEMERCR